MSVRFTLEIDLDDMEGREHGQALADWFADVLRSDVPLLWDVAICQLDSAWKVQVRDSFNITTGGPSAPLSFDIAAHDIIGNAPALGTSDD